MNKTNAMRYLENEGIPYEVISYSSSDGKIDGVSVADKVGESVECVYKTLVCRGDDVFVVVLPVHREVNLKKLAKVSGNKKVQMIAVKELLPLTGYVRGGCSPFAMKKDYPTYVQEDILINDYVLVSAGKIGVQVKLSAEDFVNASKAEVVDICAE